MFSFRHYEVRKVAERDYGRQVSHATCSCAATRLFTCLTLVPHGAAGMPEMEDLFLRYKELKKHLKAMKKAPLQVQADATAQDEDQQEEASTSGNQVLHSCMNCNCIETESRLWSTAQ